MLDESISLFYQIYTKFTPPVRLFAFHYSHNLFFQPKTPGTSLHSLLFCPVPGPVPDSAFCASFFCVHFTLFVFMYECLYSV